MTQESRPGAAAKTKGQHGLTRQEVADREERARARRDLEQTKQLLQRQWWTFSETEKWWL